MRGLETQRRAARPDPDVVAGLELKDAAARRLYRNVERAGAFQL